MNKKDLKINFYNKTKYRVKYKEKYIKEETSLEGVRQKYIINGHILKIDLDNDINHTKQEVKIFKSLDNKDRQYFVKLKFWDIRKKYVVQPIIQLKHPSEKIKEKDVKLLTYLKEKYDIEDLIIQEDDTNWNWAYNVRTGKPIIFDYGI